MRGASGRVASEAPAGAAGGGGAAAGPAARQLRQVRRRQGAGGFPARLLRACLSAHGSVQQPADQHPQHGTFLGLFPASGRPRRARPGLSSVLGDAGAHLLPGERRGRQQALLRFVWNREALHERGLACAEIAGEEHDRSRFWSRSPAVRIRSFCSTSCDSACRHCSCRSPLPTSITPFSL